MQAQWAIFIPIEHYTSVVPWVLQRHANTGGLITSAGMPGIERPPFSVIVHPCSGPCTTPWTHVLPCVSMWYVCSPFASLWCCVLGCEYEDHSIWALWAGPPAQISNVAMTEEVPFDVIPPTDPRCISC